MTPDKNGKESAIDEAHSPLKWVKMGYGGLTGKFLFCGWKRWYR